MMVGVRFRFGRTKWAHNFAVAVVASVEGDPSPYGAELQGAEPSDDYSVARYAYAHSNPALDISAQRLRFLSQ